MAGVVEGVGEGPTHGKERGEEKDEKETLSQTLVSRDTYVSLQLIDRCIPRSEYFSLQNALLPPKQRSTLGREGSSLPCSMAAKASALYRNATKP